MAADPFGGEELVKRVRPRMVRSQGERVVRRKAASLDGLPGFSVVVAGRKD